MTTKLSRLFVLHCSTTDGGPIAITFSYNDEDDLDTAIYVEDANDLIFDLNRLRVDRVLRVEADWVDTVFLTDHAADLPAVCEHIGATAKIMFDEDLRELWEHLKPLNPELAATRFLELDPYCYDSIGHMCQRTCGGEITKTVRELLETVSLETVAEALHEPGVVLVRTAAHVYVVGNSDHPAAGMVTS